MQYNIVFYSVAEHFQIDDGDDIDALVLDNHGAGIPNEKLKAVVSQFKNCAAFFVEVELLNRPNTSSAQVNVTFKANSFHFYSMLFSRLI